MKKKKSNIIIWVIIVAGLLIMTGVKKQGLADIQIVSDEVTVSDSQLIAKIVLKNNGGTTVNFLLEAQADFQSKKISYTNPSVCNPSCPYNVHTMVTLTAGETSTIYLPIPASTGKMPNGEYYVKMISGNQCGGTASAPYPDYAIIGEHITINSGIPTPSDLCTTNYCGDGDCDATETPSNCPSDCDCVPACSGKQCGDNGCGGSCGTCGTGKTCQGSQCVDIPSTNCPQDGTPISSSCNCGGNAYTKGFCFGNIYYECKYEVNTTHRSFLQLNKKVCNAAGTTIGMCRSDSTSPYFDQTLYGCATNSGCIPLKVFSADDILCTTSNTTCPHGQTANGYCKKLLGEICEQDIQCPTGAYCDDVCKIMNCSVDSNCDDSNPCTKNACDSTSFTCDFSQPTTNGTACGTGKVCYLMDCVDSCQSDSDCAEEYTCYQNKCLKGERPEDSVDACSNKCMAFLQTCNEKTHKCGTNPIFYLMGGFLILMVILKSFGKKS